MGRRVISLSVSVMIAAFVFMGCSSEQVEVVDLNKVLDVMANTLDSFKTEKAEGSEVGADGKLATIDPTKENKEYMNKFVTKYQSDLNALPIMKTTAVGVALNSDGSVEGYADNNKNLKKDGSEKPLFKVEIDAERSRLIATDLQNSYRRDRNWIFPVAGGFLAGYLMSSFLGRQKAAGVNTSRFGRMKMSPKSYHSSAVSKAKARASGGSRSFRSGK